MSRRDSRASIAPAPESEDTIRLKDIVNHLEASQADARLGLLIRLSEAMSEEDRGGTERRLDALAWRGIELLLRDVLHDLERTQQIAETHADFVTIVDESASRG